MSAQDGSTAGSSLAARARTAGMHPDYWYPAAFSEELPIADLMPIRFWGEEIVLWRGRDGRARAFEDRCPHRQIQLSHGSVSGCQLTCLYHGWTFDERGRLVDMKHDDFGRRIPVVNVRSYPTRERYGIVWFFPGDSTLAERTPLPEIPFAEGRQRWASLHFAYTWNAHHSMVIDNLCNLTHLWVHGKWVPYGRTVLGDHGVTGDRLTLRWIHDLRRDWMHPFTSPIFRNPGADNQSDTAMVYDYPYQSAVSNARVRSCNFMLPLDAKTTRVFTLQLWRPLEIPLARGRRLPARVAQLAMPLIRPITLEIFRQDGFTVEAEQRGYERHGERPIPEPNPTVKMFNALTVRKWDEASGRIQTETDLAERERVRVKVL